MYHNGNKIDLRISSPVIHQKCFPVLDFEMNKFLRSHIRTRTEWFWNDSKIGTNKSPRLINYLKFSFVLFLDRYIPDIQSPILFELSTVKSVSDRDQLRWGRSCDVFGTRTRIPTLSLLYLFTRLQSRLQVKKDESVLTFSCNSS